MNAGEQLRTIAVIVGIVIVIAGIALSFNLAEGWGLFLGMVVSAITGYLSSISLYAFGLLVDNSTEAVTILERLETFERREAEKNAAKSKVAPEA